eukprot:GDKJ01010488.1.p1 GENE.GDKJ01010488.1~~GDKJ01010488.1.p1  ORF type:complete len:1364 (+),score=424.49 GDKJ01010488.1:107-4093(+)
MRTVGMQQSEMENILKVVGGVLYLGNLTFEKDPNNSEGSIVAPSALENLQRAAELIGVDSEKLSEVLTFRMIKTMGESYRRALDIPQADDARDALSRALYGTLFLMVARRINESLSHQNLMANVESKDIDQKLKVGVLDIFGFECFEFNSFEQLCINFTNERLQQFFNTFVFKVEEAIYKEEGIHWDPLDFPDNQDCVDLLQSLPHGVFAMLDEECIVPQGSDRSFSSKLSKQHHGKHARFAPVKTKPSWFTINHFAGPVSYCSDNFLEKNRDQLLPDVQEAVANSSSNFVQFLFTEMLIRKSSSSSSTVSRGKKQVTVSLEFRDQLNSLMETVKVTEPHFIRCIKPNPSNVPDEFDRSSVNEQLRYGGVLQAVQVSRAGYPIRVKHTECINLYLSLVRHAAAKGDKTALSVLRTLKSEDDSKSKSELILRYLDASLPIPRPPLQAEITPWAVGRSLCFFKQEAYEALSTARLRMRGEAATKIQSVWKGVLQRRQYKQDRERIIKCQAFVRGKLARMERLRLKKERAILIIQKMARGFITRRRVTRDRRCLVTLQSVIRTFVAKKNLIPLKENNAASRIQAFFKGRKERKFFIELKLGVKAAQLKWRAILARRQLRRLKQEAKEAGALLAKVQLLQEEVSRLTKQAAEDEAKRYKDQREIDNKNSFIAKLEAEIAKLNKKITEDLEPRIEEQKADIVSLQTAKTSLKETAELLQKNLTESRSKEINVPELSRALEEASRDLRSKEAQILTLIRERDEAQQSALLSDEALTRFKQRAVHSGGIDVPVNKTTSASSEYAVDREDISSLPSTDVEVQTLMTGVEIDALVHQQPQQRFATTANLASQAQPQPSQQPSQQQAAAASAQESKTGWSWMNTITNMIKPTTGGGSGTPANANQTNSTASQSIQLLRNSIRASQEGRNEYKRQQVEGVRPNERRLDGWNDVRAVQELQEADSAVTCVVFGQEREHLHYSLLACAAKDGQIVVYRIYRTAAEIEALPSNERKRLEQKQSQSSNIFDRPPKSEMHLVNVHARLSGHSRAVTSIFFSLLEDQIISTSIDKTVRFWSVESGDMFKVFTDSSPALVAAFLPFNPQVFVAANSNKVVRLVNVTTGQVIQKLKVESEIRALRFDDTGLFCLAGTKNGAIHIFEAADNANLKFKFKQQLAHGALTCITFVPARNDKEVPLLFVNACDSSVAIVECLYGPPGVLSQLRVRHRVKVAHSLLPLRSCYSSFGGGFLITASEDKEVYVYTVDPQHNYRMHYLKHHNAPVLAVATNSTDSLLVSADSLGHIVFWRRLDFVSPPNEQQPSLPLYAARDSMNASRQVPALQQ